MVSQTEVRPDLSPRPSLSITVWPWSMWLFLAGVALVYAPIIVGAAGQWISNDNYAHGFFIFPVSIFLLWMRKDQIQAAERKPEAWGLLLILIGLLGAIGGYLMQIKYIGMWSLIPTLAGGILALHGRQLWKIVQFSVWFLLFAAPIPNSFLGPLTGQIQGLSTTGAAMIMGTLGYPVIQQANVLQVPGASLEVATACSGFHKLISLLAFAAIYGHLFLDSSGKRSLLILMAIPIALLVNVLRICGLVAAAIYGGLPLLHATHDPAEIVAIGVSFVLFVLVGTKLGCKTLILPPPVNGIERASASKTNINGMQNTRLLAIVSGLMVFSVAALGYAAGPIPVPHPHKLAVDTFPSKLGPWQGGTIAPTDPDIQARLPTSEIMDREYRMSDGQGADVMLVTASDNLDIHNPTDCFPSQGWRLTNQHNKVLQGQTVSVMNADLGSQKMTVLYWTTGVYMPPSSRYALVRKVSALRDKIVPRHESVSLFVRLMVPQGPNAEETITQLAEQVLPPVQSLLEGGKKPGEQLTALPSTALPKSGMRVALSQTPKPNDIAQQKGI
jgi:EpsI family protein